MTALVAVAHGSRDPRSAAGAATLAGAVGTARPDLDVRLAFLDLSAPRLPDVLAAVAADGHRAAVVVPLLLSHAYHARVDIPGAVAAARLPRLDVRIADVLGPDPRLPAAALRRLTAAGATLDDPHLGVVLAAAGSSHRPATDAVARIAAHWSAHTPWVGAVAAFATTATPAVPDALAALRRRGARRLAIASWFLFPGVLTDRVTAAALATDPRTLIAQPLVADGLPLAARLDATRSPTIDLARLVLDRYHAALPHPQLATG